MKSRACVQSIAVVTAALTAALTTAEPLYAWPDAASLPAMPAVTSPAAPDFPGLPDPLQFFDHAAGSPFGAAVQDGAAWRYQRRPEILDMLRHYMYGHEPPPPTDVTFAVISVEPGFLDGTATKKVVRGVYGPPGSRPMVMNLYMPNAVEGPVPVIAALNAQGNEAIEPGGPRAGRWDLPGTLGAGIALATAAVDDFAADSANRHADALIEPHAEAGFPGNWRTQGAWAWGLSRMVDYLETVPALDPHRIAVTGFSRRGKAALWAGALDERIALVGPHQSGAGGPVPNRPGWGNNTGYRNSFTWWFLPAFNEMPLSDYERLPFDQHFQVALIAPRRAFFTENSSSGADFNGALAIRVAAQPVWSFLGADAETGVVLEWDPNSTHRHEPYHWAALHATVLSLPKGGAAGFREWAVALNLEGAEDPGVATADLARTDFTADGVRALESFFLGLDPLALQRATLRLEADADGRFRIRIPTRRDGTGHPGSRYVWRGVEQSLEQADNPNGPWIPFLPEELQLFSVESGDSPTFEWVTLEDRRTAAGSPVFYRLRYTLEP